MEVIATMVADPFSPPFDDVLALRSLLYHHRALIPSMGADKSSTVHGAILANGGEIVKCCKDEQDAALVAALLHPAVFRRESSWQSPHRS